MTITAITEKTTHQKKYVGKNQIQKDWLITLMINTKLIVKREHNIGV